MAGKPVVDMLRRGNVDVNHRLQINNSDGTGSSIFSVTVPLDRTGQAVPWESPNIANYALIPGIDQNGKFFTPNGKKPKGESYEGTDGEEKAAAYYNRTGQHLGIFKTAEAANNYASHTHAWKNDGSAKKVYVPSY